MKTYKMRYNQAADDSLRGWETQSLPIGNGYFGASVFGGVKSDRIQFTTNEFANVYALGGVTNFADLYIDAACEEASDYERGLNLNNGTVYSRFVSSDGAIERTAFCSYPDNVFVYKVKAEKKKDFSARLIVPYLGSRKIEEGGRTGEIHAENNSLVLREKLPLRNCTGEFRLSALSNGTIDVTDEKIMVTGATEVMFLGVLGTNYKLCPEVFFDDCHKALGEDPHEKLKCAEEENRKKGYGKLFKRHAEDYEKLMNRASVDLGGKEDRRTVSELLSSFRGGKNEPYLLELYFQYGRHLLVSSSRKGTPPASLQGTWTAHDKSPWGSGIWHNINVQMNYWCALNTNLAETFPAYADYWKAYLLRAEKYAEEWVKHFVPSEQRKDCGWIIGTAAFLYEIGGLGESLHSGPGTGGLTAKMFADYYDYTQDKEFLKNYAYPAVHGCSQFMQKSVKKYGNEYLCRVSASPEQILSGVWVNGYKDQQYYATVGCSFDQQLLYETAKDDIRFSKILGMEDETLKTEKCRLNRFAPVKIGYSGQIKEYGEEHFYGEIGAAKHRHISQLMALMPGDTINEDTPAWADSAKRTLDFRGNDSTGWALAYRILCRARAGDGENAYKLLQKLLCEKTNDNLWDEHPPFQIDGNFGATAGIAEMLLQSRNGSISLFPAIPKKWKNVSFENLRARGNFVVSATRKDGKIMSCRILSLSGGKIGVRGEGIFAATVIEKSTGKKVRALYRNRKLMFATEKGCEYLIENFVYVCAEETVKNFRAEWGRQGVKLKWRYEGRVPCAVYRAIENDKDYSLLAITDRHEYIDMDFSLDKRARITYKIVVAMSEYSSGSPGKIAFLHPASSLEYERYKLRLAVNDMYAKDWPLR